MTLSYGFNSAADILAKAKRELSALESGLANQDEVAVADAMFDISVALSSVRDWLKLHPSPSFTPSDVDAYFNGDSALNSFQDAANATKHGKITKYTPRTTEVAHSLTAQNVLAPLLGPDRHVPTVKKDFVVKIVKPDGARINALTHAREAIEAWDRFFAAHGI